MAVALTATEYSGTGTGALATFGTGIYANASDQIKVYVAGVLKTIGADYTLNNIGGSGGVDVVGNFTLGAAVYVERVTPLTQLVDTQNNETILEDVLDAEFDKLTMIAQEISGKADRALAALAGAGVSTSNVVTAQADVALSKTEFVNLYMSGGVLHVRKADASDPTRYAHGFVVTSVAAGAVASIALIGLNPITVGAAVTEVFLSDTTPGSYTSVAPSADGRIVQKLGAVIPGVGIYFTQQGRIAL